MYCVDKGNVRGNEQATTSFANAVRNVAENSEAFDRGSRNEMALLVDPCTRDTATDEDDDTASKTVMDTESPTKIGFGSIMTLGAETTKIEASSCRLLWLQL